MAIGLLGVDVHVPMWQFFAVTLADALAGTALGLLASSFARTQFQVGQFTPALIFPQFLQCGLLVPRDDLPTALEKLSNVLPLSYAVDAITKVSAGDTATGLEMAALGGFLVVFLVLAAVSMRRQTP